MSVRLVVIAKSPQPGRSKTRLTAPLRPAEQAARPGRGLARATPSRAVAATPCEERVLALAGPPGDWLPDGFRGRRPGRGRRSTGASPTSSRTAAGPTLLIGMDTPQVAPWLLEEAIAALEAPGIDAVLGHAEDGGYWAIGLRRPDPRRLRRGADERRRDRRAPGRRAARGSGCGSTCCRPCATST